MNNFNATESIGKAVSPAIELMRRATEQAVNEAMEDQCRSQRAFASFGRLNM